MLAEKGSFTIMIIGQRSKIDHIQQLYLIILVVFDKTSKTCWFMASNVHKMEWYSFFHASKIVKNR